MMFAPLDQTTALWFSAILHAVLTISSIQPLLIDPQPNGPVAAPAAPEPEEQLEVKLSPLNQLDPAAIPPEERCSGMPPGVVAVIGSPRGRHWGGVTCVAYSPDGRLVATGGKDDCVRVWEAATLREVSVLNNCEGVCALAFSPDGGWLTVGAAVGPKPAVWGWIRLYDAKGDAFLPGERVGFDHAGVTELAFSRDGSVLAAGLRSSEFNMETLLHGEGARGVQLWDVTHGTLRERAELRNDAKAIWSVAFSPDGRKLAAVGDASIELWDLSGETPTELVKRLDFWYTARSVLAGVVTVFVALCVIAWRTSSSRKQSHLWMRRILYSAAVFAAVSLAACLIVCSILSNSNKKYDKPWEIDLPASAQLVAVVFTPDGRALVTGGRDGKVRLRSLSGEKSTQQAVLKGHEKELTALALSPEGHTLASASLDGTVRLWDLDDDGLREKAVLRGAEDEVWAVAFAPDGRTLASGCNDGVVRHWDLTGAAPVERVEGPGRAVLARSMGFAADGQTLAVGCADKTVRLWDLSGKTPKERRVLSGLLDVPWTLALSPDGRMLAVGCADKSVRLWNLGGEEPREWAPLPGLKADPTEAEQDAKFKMDFGWITISPSIGFPRLRFSPNGNFLLASRNQFEVWDVSGARPRERVDLRIATGNVKFSDDGRCLAVYKKEVQTLRDLTSENLKEQAVLPTDVIDEMAFVLDGQTLTGMASRGPHAVKSWDLESKACKKQLDLDESVGIPWDSGRGWGESKDFHLTEWDVTLAPDHRTVAAVSAQQKKLVVWSTITGKILHEFQVPNFGRQWAAPKPFLYAPDGRHIALMNENGTVYILRLGPAYDSEELLASCEAILKRDPHDVEALLRRGCIRLRRKDLDGAVADFTEVIRLAPGDARAHHQRGLAYTDKGDYARAKADLEKAVLLDPTLGR